MSTQAGQWNFEGEPVRKGLLDRISALSAEYSPDGEMNYCQGGLGMLYRPLHTIPESPLERQPYVSKTGNIATWDGRLDNRDELIRQLERVLPRDDRTDVAIVMAAFEQWSTACFAMLTGDWAFVVWKASEKELILARDYIGARHLYYHLQLDRVTWCSHLAPLALLGDKFAICDEYIAGFLATYPDADLTPYREIRSVPPGKFVRIRNRTAHVSAYWTFRPRPEFRHKTDSEYEEHFLYLFRQAVARRLRTNSNLLAELSGGLDSSSIVCMADDILAKGGAPITSFDTFSFWDPTEPEGEDLPYILKVEEKRGRAGHHAEFRGTGDSICFDSPDFLPIPGFGAREELKAAARNVLRSGNYRVVLSGFGGDELLGQAMDPRVQLSDLLVSFRFLKFSRQLMAWSLFIRRPLIQMLGQIFRMLLPVSFRARFTPPDKADEWINKKFARRQRLSVRRLEVVKARWYLFQSDRDSAQTHGSLAQQLTYTLPSAQEIRHPYLDQDLAEFLMTIPRDQLARPGDRRSLMRRALKHLLPKEVLERRTKAGASRCVILSLQKNWKLIEDALASPLSSRLGYMNREEFHSLLSEVTTGKAAPLYGRFLQGLALEFWLRNVTQRGIISVLPAADLRKHPLPVISGCRGRGLAKS